MDKKELLEKFCSLYTEATTSKDAEDMRVSLAMFKKAVKLLTEVSFRDAKELVECYEGSLKYYNFLTETEASELLDTFVNQDGSRGPKWRDPEAFFQKVTELGGKIECEPHYNKWALYVTMNKTHAMQSNVILKWVGDDRDKYVVACYELALSHLKNKNHLSWIRKHFGLSETI